VKTTTCTASSGSWFVGVGRHARGGRKRGGRLPYSADEVDLFAIFDGELVLYLIPMVAIAGRTGICLAPYRQFIVGSAESMFSRRTQGFKWRPRRPVQAFGFPDAGVGVARFRQAASDLPLSPERESRVGTGHERAEALRASDEKPAEQADDLPESDRRWTEDELRAATQKATSWADLLTAFGYKSSSTRPRRALQRELKRHEIDTSHFVGQRTWSDQALIEAAKTAETWAELLAALGLSTASKSCDSVRAAARRLGVELSRLTLGPKAGREAIDIDLPGRPTLGHLRHAAPSIAAAWFLICGRAVSVPCEPEAYDMIVDLPDGLRRVQVKSATSRDARGAWNVRIGHRPDGSSKAADFIPYGQDEVELFFVVDGDLLLYLIPADATAGKTTLSLRTYRGFIVGDASSLMESLDPMVGSGASPLRPAS
jgi:PD-(D/E)XK endonuclease